MPRYREGKVFEVGGWWLDRVPGSPFWYGFRYDAESGRVRRTSLGVENFEDAKLALSARAVIAAPKRIDSCLSPILESYFEDASDEKPSADQARLAGAIILEFWGAAARASDISDKKQRAFCEWSRARGHSVSYIARNLSVLSAALRHGLGDAAPRVWTWSATVASKIGAPEPEPREWIPTDAQLAAFLDGLSKHQGEHVFRYCLLALNTLARPAAILELTAGQVDWEHGLIALNTPGRRQTKKRRPVVRIPATLEPWLAAWGGTGDELYVSYRGAPIARVRHTFKRQGATLGFPELTPYSLRHKMATELRARGVSREDLAYQMGHKLPDLRTTDRYTKFDKRYLETAKAVIEEYLRDLNKIAIRELLEPSLSLKILPKAASMAQSARRHMIENVSEIMAMGMVGATRIELVTPTMST
jgi:integrase